MPNSAKPKHPNRIPFEGVLALADVASDMAPHGSNGHRLLLLRSAVEEAIPSLIGMPVGFSDNWQMHNMRQRCGVITEAFLRGDELIVRGHLYGYDFPEIAQYMNSPDADMGMSYELLDAKVTSMRAAVYEIYAFTFRGAAIMMRDRAAYSSTSLSIEAGAEFEQFTGRLVMSDAGPVRLLGAGDVMPRQPSRMTSGRARLRGWARKLKGQRPN